MSEEVKEENKEIDKESKKYKFIAGKGVMNLPNKLTISRMVMIPVFILFFYLQFTGHYFVALGIFAIACITDLLDGKIARKYNLVTNLGKFLDPIADKVLVLSALVIILTVPEFICWSFGTAGLIAMGCGVAVILAREIIVSGFRMVASNAGKVIAADIFGKYKTTFQDIAVVLIILTAGIWELIGLHEAVDILNYIWMSCFAIAVILTIISGVNYIVKNIEVLKS